MYGFFKIQTYEKPSHNSHNTQNEREKDNCENCENEFTETENLNKEIDFSNMRLIDVCADPELTKLFRAKYPVKPSETILCPKGTFHWRLRLDCNSCDGDPWCIAAIL